MKKALYLFITLLFVFIVCAIPTSVGADLGDFNDYDTGGDYDFGGYDSYDYDYDYDYDSDRSYGGSRVYIPMGGGSGFDFGGFVKALIIVIIIVAIYMSRSKKQSTSTPQRTAQPSVSSLKDYTEEISSAIRQNDENFSCDKFESWVKEVFFTLQNAWSERDFEKARPFEKEELYRQHEMQIKKYIENNRINVLDRINISNAYLYRYVRDNEYEYLTVFIQARMVDYIKDANTGAILKGDPNKDCHMKYLYTFMRKTGVKTDPAKSNNSVVACPHCGAPTSITSAGKCEYCGFIVTTGEFDWVLSDIEAVKNGTTPPSGGVFIKDNN